VYIFKTFGRALLRLRKSQIQSSTYTKTHDTCRILHATGKRLRKCVVRLNKDAILPAWPAIHMLKWHSGSVCPDDDESGRVGGSDRRPWPRLICRSWFLFFQLTLIGALVRNNEPPS